MARFTGPRSTAAGSSSVRTSQLSPAPLGQHFVPHVRRTRRPRYLPRPTRPRRVARVGQRPDALEKLRPRAARRSYRRLARFPPRRQRPRSRLARSRHTHACLARPPHTQRRPPRPPRAIRPRSHRASRSRRCRPRRYHASQRSPYPQGPRPHRRYRHHLRIAPQRHRRLRYPLPKKR